jgi:hypothetical protein
MQNSSLHTDFCAWLVPSHNCTPDSRVYCRGDATGWDWNFIHCFCSPSFKLTTFCASITLTAWTVWPVIIVIVDNRIRSRNECEFCLFQRIAELHMARVDEIDWL